MNTTFCIILTRSNSYISVEIATLSRENGSTRITILPSDEVERAIKKFEEIEAKAEAEKKKAEKDKSST